MTVGQVLLQSVLVTGRVTVLLSFGALGLIVLANLPRIERRGEPAELEDRRSAAGLGLTLAACVFVPLCVSRGWGSVQGSLPGWLAALFAAAGSVTCFIALSFMGWAALVLGRAAHFLARVDRGGRLVREGPFQLVRHPVYFSLG